jgi:hypothetical protein
MDVPGEEYALGIVHRGDYLGNCLSKCGIYEEEEK